MAIQVVLLTLCVSMVGAMYGNPVIEPRKKEEFIKCSGMPHPDKLEISYCRKALGKIIDINAAASLYRHPIPGEPDRDLMIMPRIFYDTESLATARCVITVDVAGRPRKNKNERIFFNYSLMRKLFADYVLDPECGNGGSEKEPKEDPIKPGFITSGLDKTISSLRDHDMEDDVFIIKPFVTVTVSSKEDTAIRPGDSDPSVPARVLKVLNSNEYLPRDRTKEPFQRLEAFKRAIQSWQERLSLGSWLTWWDPVDLSKYRPKNLKVLCIPGYGLPDPRDCNGVSHSLMSKRVMTLSKVQAIDTNEYIAGKSGCSLNFGT